MKTQLLQQIAARLTGSPWSTACGVILGCLAIAPEAWTSYWLDPPTRIMFGTVALYMLGANDSKHPGSLPAVTDKLIAHQEKAAGVPQSKE